jgi:hypothetical protein
VDAVVALTSPPLISFLGALFARLKGGSFFFWVMDLNPDEAIAAGWLKADSLTARFFGRLLRYSLNNAERVIALDRFMKCRIVDKGVPGQKVVVLPPWAHNDNVRFDPEGRAAFRKEHKLESDFVVMYAGNHSPCHPLDTLVEAARSLSDHKEIVFCFVGGGSEQDVVRKFAEVHNLNNVRCLPYQPFERLSASLSAADLHVVIMGNEFVGIVHPSKLYNVLTVGSPFLYIGPADTHISEIAAEIRSEHNSYSVVHGDVNAVVDNILQAVADRQDERRVPPIAQTFSKESLLPRLIELLGFESLPDSVAPSKTNSASCVSAAR